MSSMLSLIRCAQDHKLTLCDINGHIGHWVKTCRDGSGNHPTTEDFKTAWEAELTRRSQQPQNSFEEGE